MGSDIQVSISCTTYNHEKYIRQCLDGFLMQKDVAFEILIHDDASTDHTADIIREYESKYPDVVKPIYQTENQYSKGVKISSFQHPRVTGKYYAICEGDDCWTDPYKLKKQYDALEKNADCHMCVHKVQGMKEDGVPQEVYYPSMMIEGGTIKQDKMLNLMIKGYPFHTSSYFVRSEYIKEYGENPPKFVSVADIGDIPICLYFCSKGNIFYLEDSMSYYRMNSVSSWNVSIRKSIDKQLSHYNSMIFMCREYETYVGSEGLLKNKIAYYKYVIYSLKNDYKNAYRILRDYDIPCEKKEKASCFLNGYFPALLACYRKIHGRT